MNGDKRLKHIAFYVRKVVEVGDRKRWAGRWDRRCQRSQRLIAYKTCLNAWLRASLDPGEGGAARSD